MAFKPIDARIRKDPLGFSGFNTVNENQASNERLMLVDHTPDGLHNSLEVPRAVGLIRYTGGAYVIHSSSSSFISSVATPATGTCTITLTADVFQTPMAVRITPMDSTGDSLPWLPTHEVVSATSIKVYLKKLSALSGDTWNNTDGSFAISIHSAPYYSSATPLTRPSDLVRGATRAAATWDPLIENQAKLRSYQSTEHTAGVHTSKHFPIGYAYWASSGSGALSTRYNVSSAAVGGTTGQVTLTLPGSTYTAPFPVMCHPGLAPFFAIDVALVSCVPEDELTATNVNVYSYYLHPSGTWLRVPGCDLGIQLHRGT
jgi:hypothetical protein